MIKFAILHDDGDDFERWEIEHQERITLPYLQGLVGGNIEALTLADRCVMFINEDGKEMGLRLNHTATALAREAGIGPWDAIVGTAVIFGPSDGSGNETSITAAMLERLGKV